MCSDENENTSNERGLFCSFCEKDTGSVRTLIQGPSAYICDECVMDCCEILYDKGVLKTTFCVSDYDLELLNKFQEKTPDPRRILIGSNDLYDLRKFVPEFFGELKKAVVSAREHEEQEIREEKAALQEREELFGKMVGFSEQPEISGDKEPEETHS